MQNGDIFYQDLIEQDWGDHNLRVLKHCLEQTSAAISDQTSTAQYPFLATPHFTTVYGVSRWAVLDYFLEAATKNLFEGITPVWNTWQGAPILELHGKHTILTACHVLSSDDAPKDSKNGYRKNNRAKNQTNLELFKEFEAAESEDKKLHIVFLHGDNFAYLRIYLTEESVPQLTTNIMLMPALDAAPETEFVPDPTVLPQKSVSEPEVLPEILLKPKKNGLSQS